VRVITKAAYEGDIVSRLRNWRGLHLAHFGRIFDEAADAIEALRQEAAALRGDREVAPNADRPRPDEAW
jgi:hypothetical protein